MGIAIAVIVTLFVIGSIMGLKPSGIDMRLDKLRMAARKAKLNPKLIACPDWIRGKENEFGKGMLAQYGIVIENIQLPHIRYQIIKDPTVSDMDQKYLLRAHHIIEGEKATDFSLDNQPLQLPASITPFVKAIEAKANSIIIYWEDIAYVRPRNNPNYSENNIEPELQALHQRLSEWANTINNT